jgi:hypothetical protein
MPEKIAVGRINDGAKRQKGWHGFSSEKIGD